MHSFERIQEMVARLLIECDIVEPPIGLEKVASHLSLTLHPSMMDDNTDGMLVIKNGKAAIGFNHSHPSNRKRFTVAHEIGHYVLHCKVDDVERLFYDRDLKFYRRTLASTKETNAIREEKEANVFAANLLMPEQMVLRHTEAIDLFGDQDVEDLALKFGVSSIAMTYRLQNLGILL